MAQMSQRIPTYFSHSYSPGDRQVNVHFCNLFWNEGFAFTVAPQSGRFSIPHLELMMRRSACYVAIATHRPEVSHYLTSPYLVFEYGMAVQANKPRLVFVEPGVAGHFFEQSKMLVFDRGDIDEESEQPYMPQHWRPAIERLHEMSAAYSHDDDRALGSVGLLLPQEGVYGDVKPAIHDLLRRAGYDVFDVDHDELNHFELILEADRHDFIVLDIDADEMPAWLHPLLCGRFVPMVRLLHHEPGARPVSSVPEVLRGYAIGLVAEDDQLTICWSSRDELISMLEQEVERLKRPRVQFRSLPEAMGYFNSLGRAVDGAVFVSNAAPENDFAQRLSRLLDLNNIPFFHYVYRNTIPMGAQWTDRLRGRLEDSQLFVPLITTAYWESEVCRQEYHIAEDLHEQGRLDIYPYFLEDMRDTGPAVALQGRTLRGLPLDQQLSAIVRDIDGYLMRKAVAGNGK